MMLSSIYLFLIKLQTITNCVIQLWIVHDPVDATQSFTASLIVQKRSDFDNLTTLIVGAADN